MKTMKNTKMTHTQVNDITSLFLILNPEKGNDDQIEDKLRFTVRTVTFPAPLNNENKN